MKNGEKVKVGFIGVGTMGQCAHLRNYAVIDECEVAAIAEIREKTAKAIAVRYRVPKIYEEHEAMLSAERLDGIVASQQFVRHGVLLKDLARTGLPIFIEKPLAGSIAVGQTILDALSEGGAKLMVGYHKRSDPATTCAKGEIDRLKESGELGNLKYVRITMPAGDWIAGGFAGLIDCGDPKPQLEFDPPPENMDEKTREKFRSFVNYYIHQVNLMRYLLGESYKVSYADPSGVLLVGQSENGVACAIEMSPYRTTVDWQETAMVAFEYGYVKLNLPAPLACNRPGTVEIFKDPDKSQTPVFTCPQLPWVGAMQQQAANFIRFVKGEIQAPCDAAEALEDLKVAEQYIQLLGVGRA